MTTCVLTTSWEQQMKALSRFWFGDRLSIRKSLPPLCLALPSAPTPHALTSQTPGEPPSVPNPSPQVTEPPRLTQVDSAPRSARAHCHTWLKGTCDLSLRMLLDTIK